MSEPVRIVLTEGFSLYVRLRRGVYAQVNRHGERSGSICSGFEPRPRWRPARLCEYDEYRTLTCARCGRYDNRYAQTGLRSYCAVQSRRAAEFYRLP